MSTLRKSRNYYSNNRGANYRRPAPRKSPARRQNTGWSMKLGAWAHARLREAQYDSVSRKVLQGLSIGTIAIIFFAIAAATGVTADISNAISTKAADITRAAGLAVRKVEVVGVQGSQMSDAQIAEAEAIAGVISESVMFGVNPKEIHDRVMVLPWVEGVIVRRLWPSTVQIVVKPRAANALWQNNGQLRFIDAGGKDLGLADPQKVKNLPIVIGHNANKAAPEAFKALSTRREIANRTFALIRIGDRRWNIRLRNGGEIMLPEKGLEAALDNLENLQNQYRILDRTFTRLDVRRPGFLLIRKGAEAAPATTQNT